MNINLMGSYYAMRVVLPGMIERGWGRIHLYTSGAAHGSGIPQFSAYSVSKAAVDMLVRVSWIIQDQGDVKRTDVTINLISPGMVDTPMQKDVRTITLTEDNADALQVFHEAHDEGKLDDPVTVAQRAVAMLYGSMNGETIHLYNLSAGQRALVEAYML